MINTRSRKGCERVDFQDVVLALLLIAAGIRDCLTGQISNRLCVAGWAAGIAAGIVRRGAAGLCFWAGGAVPAVILFFLCYLCGAVGAGDVKLAALMGLYLGGGYTLRALMTGVLSCAVYSAVQIIRKKMTVHDGVAMAPFLYFGTVVSLIL